MYKTFRGLYPPEDSVTIWRYIDFTKFVDLLNSESLYFTRADRFEDPFEGLYPVRDVIDKEFEEYDEVRKHDYVSCWSIGEHESAALWKIYSDSKNSIAIKSTFRGLRQAIESATEDIYASVVRYRDFETTDIFKIIKENEWEPGGKGSTVFPIIYKRMSFSFENELRLIYIKLPIQEKATLQSPIGHKVPVNVESLCDKIYLSPHCQDWFYDLVNGVLKKYNLGHKEIVKSDLYKGLR